MQVALVSHYQTHFFSDSTKLRNERPMGAPLSGLPLPARLMGAPASPARQKQLCDAIEDGDATEVRRLLAAGTDPSMPGPDKPTWPPLCVAAAYYVDYVETVQALLHFKADPATTTTEKAGKSALAIAIENGNKDVASVLKKARRDPEAAGGGYLDVEPDDDDDESEEEEE